MEMNQLFNLENKTAIITGGGKGLGVQMAHALAEAGANIVLCSRNLEVCERACEELKGIGVKTLALKCDITKSKDIEHVVNETIRKFGSVDILINNSGTSWIAPFLELPEEKWDKVMAVNVKGAFLFSQAVTKEMIKQGGGKIINIASVTGFGGTPPKLLDTIAYNTSKGALMTFTKDLAVKLAPHHIQVNAIAPGFFPTKMTEKVLSDMNKAIVRNIPAGRFGNEEDLKGAALFLASKASNYVTGHVLVVDGGITALV
ncbi:SDR family oxidoreductase [Bacillus sp. FJAT-45066]|uniref:SDR family oxidoreductase n=1 Tax=Bacillus sp. FJAT-45066 TaxID=2011010 RepID=UPI000BB772E9|nr:SDR family oxidoreductase [Bacillus sp. FJAT-45066]